jgi:hypothetical protein
MKSMTACSSRSGWSDRIQPPGETYRFEFFDPETFAIAMITASEEKEHRRLYCVGF